MAKHKATRFFVVDTSEGWVISEHKTYKYAWTALERVKKQHNRFFALNRFRIFARVNNAR